MLLLAIVIGLLVGAGAGVLLEGNNDLILVDGLFGMAGGVLGYIFIGLLSVARDSEASVNIPGLLGSAIGAVVAVFIINGLHAIFDRRSSRRLPPDSEL